LEKRNVQFELTEGGNIACLYFDDAIDNVFHISREVFKITPKILKDLDIDNMCFLFPSFITPDENQEKLLFDGVYKNKFITSLSFIDDRFFDEYANIKHLYCVKYITSDIDNKILNIVNRQDNIVDIGIDYLQEKHLKQFRHFKKIRSLYFGHVGFNGELKYLYKYIKNKRIVLAIDNENYKEMSETGTFIKTKEYTTMSDCPYYFEFYYNRVILDYIDRRTITDVVLNAINCDINKYVIQRFLY
jgi:hypothetical protein